MRSLSSVQWPRPVVWGASCWTAPKVWTSSWAAMESTQHPRPESTAANCDPSAWSSLALPGPGVESSRSSASPQNDRLVAALSHATRYLRSASSRPTERRWSTSWPKPSTPAGTTTWSTSGRQSRSCTQRTRRSPPVCCALRTKVLSIDAAQLRIISTAMPPWSGLFAGRAYRSCTRGPSVPLPTQVIAERDAGVGAGRGAMSASPGSGPAAHVPASADTTHRSPQTAGSRSRPLASARATGDAAPPASGAADAGSAAPARAAPATSTATRRKRAAATGRDGVRRDGAGRGWVRTAPPPWGSKPSTRLPRLRRPGVK